MSKPIRTVQIRAPKGQWRTAKAVFDTGAFESIIAEAALPPGSVVEPTWMEEVATARKGGRLRITGSVMLVIRIGQKEIGDHVFIAPDLGRDLLIGAGTMQRWDISIKNAGGRTRVVVRSDRRDPDLLMIG